MVFVDCCRWGIFGVGGLGGFGVGCFVLMMMFGGFCRWGVGLGGGNVVGVLCFMLMLYVSCCKWGIVGVGIDLFGVGLVLSWDCWVIVFDKGFFNKV